MTISDKEYNLEIVLEGLQHICMTNEEKNAYFANPKSALGDNFDFIVLDYLSGAVEADLIPKETAIGIDKLFREADAVLSSLSPQEEDSLFVKKLPLVEQWQTSAMTYIDQIKLHNIALKK